MQQSLNPEAFITILTDMDWMLTLSVSPSTIVRKNASTMLLASVTSQCAGRIAATLLRSERNSG